MAITFSAAVGVNAPAVFDANTKALGGAVSTGIGLRGTDGTSVAGAMYIGNPTATSIKFDTNQDATTP